MDPTFCQLYNEQYRSYQFGPRFEPASLQRSRHWAVRTGDVLRAAISLEDVRDAKQNVLIRLPIGLGILFPALRSLRRLLPIPSLPKEQEPIRILYIKALACLKCQETALHALLRTARDVAYREEYHFLAVGIHEHDPARRWFAKYPRFTFRSDCFVAGLKRESEEMRSVVSGTPYEDYSLV